MLVDALEDVAPFDSSAAAAGHRARRRLARSAGCGMVERDGEPMLAIDLAALIPAPAIAA